MCMHLWLTWNKKHDPCSERAIEPLKSREVSEGEDSCNDASEARHGRQDHKGTSGIPVGWRGQIKQKSQQNDEQEEYKI